MSNDYRIWITYHKDGQVGEYGLHEDATHVLFASHKDAEKRNINHMNPVYSEMVTMWFVWKNNLKSSYVGFEHYRRRFDTIRLPKRGECQVRLITDFAAETVYEQYARCHNGKDMDIILSLLNEKYGEENGYSNHILRDHWLISNCCFIMRWNDFTKMCDFMFPLLEEFAKRCGISLDNVEGWRKKAIKDFNGERTQYQTRVLSFLAERLISAWIAVNLYPYIDGYNVAIVHYNTPTLIEKAILSLRKNSPGCHVYILDNSDKKPLKKKMKDVEIFDNTKGQLIDFKKWIEGFPDREPTKNDYGSAKHAYSIQWLMDRIGKPFVLMDSDTLVCGCLYNLFDKEVAYAAYIADDTYYQGFPILRALPVLCYLNVPLLKANDVRYFNAEWMWNLSSKAPQNHYDTGAWLYDEVRAKNLPYRKIEIDSYVKHMWHGSWVDDPDKEERWLKENEALWK